MHATSFDRFSAQSLICVTCKTSQRALNQSSPHQTSGILEGPKLSTSKVLAVSETENGPRFWPRILRRCKPNFRFVVPRRYKSLKIFYSSSIFGIFNKSSAHSNTQTHRQPCHSQGRFFFQKVESNFLAPCHICSKSEFCDLHWFTLTPVLKVGKDEKNEFKSLQNTIGIEIIKFWGKQTAVEWSVVYFSIKPLLSRSLLSSFTFALTLLPDFVFVGTLLHSI